MHGRVGAEKINYEDVGLPPRGVYNATIAKAEFATTKAGNPAIKLQLQVDKSFEGEPVNERVFDMLLFSGKPLKRVKDICAALDVTPPETNGLEDLETFAKDLFTAARGGMWVALKQETWDGQDRLRVEFQGYLTADKAQETHRKLVA